MPNLTQEDEDNFVSQVLTQDERAAINVALETASPWSHDKFENPIKSNLEAVKKKIKDFHFERVSKKCCYCRRSLQDASIESDREHIVPKSKKKVLSYSIFNLSIACKRCNMMYKREKTDHIIDFETIEDAMRDRDRYHIPHPNLDDYEDHLRRISFQDGELEFTSYQRKSSKGCFLYDFVGLDKLCVNEIDKSQGGGTVDEFIAEFLSLPIGGT